MATPPASPFPTLGLLARTTHELSTPIATIKGYLEMLALHMAGELTPPQAKFVQAALQGTTKLEQIVQDLDSYARVAGGDVELVLESFGLPALLYESVGMLHEKIQASEIRLQFYIHDDLAPVYADKVRVGQILTNLIGNAIKYTPPGGDITIRAQNHESEVTISIADTGVGMRESDLARVFQPFFRADHPFVRGKAGTGLGLMITKHLVEKQGGTITLTSTLDVGTTVTFTLPKASSANGAGDS